MVKPKNRFHKTALYINDGVNFCITSVNFHSAEFPLKINSIQFATAELSRIGNFIYSATKFFVSFQADLVPDVNRI